MHSYGLSSRNTKLLSASPNSSDSVFKLSDFVCQLICHAVKCSGFSGLCSDSRTAITSASLFLLAKARRTVVALTEHEFVKPAVRRGDV